MINKIYVSTDEISDVENRYVASVIATLLAVRPREIFLLVSEVLVGEINERRVFCLITPQNSYDYVRLGEKTPLSFCLTLLWLWLK
jgi:hypothetical protein